MSKVFEKTLYNQIDNFVKVEFSNLLISFRNNHSTQHYLMCMLEMCRGALNKVGYALTIFMYLSKVFDKSNHNLLLGKLEAFGLKRELMSFMKCLSKKTKY